MAKLKSPTEIVRSAMTGFSEMTRTVFTGQSAEFKTLIFIIGFMLMFGTTMVFSSSFVDQVSKENSPIGELIPQLASIVIGSFLLIVFAFVRPEITRKLAPTAVIGGVLLQMLVVFSSLGASVNGNRNWINIFGFSLQPSEFLKIALILYVAHVLNAQTRFDRTEWQFWIMPSLTFGVMAFLVGVAGSDVGTALIMAFILFGMYYLGGLPWKYVKLLAVAAVIAVPAIMMSNASRRGRVMAWLNPNAPDPNNFNWQTEHGKWAFASGGPFGVGLGNSKMKWSWLPEAQNDFIFAIIGEEFGLVGALLTIGLFVALGMTLFKVARKTIDPYQRLVVYGVTFWIMCQAFVNISVVLTIIPVLGVPLPLISAGGTAMLSTLIALGIVLGIERNNTNRPALKVVSGGRRR